MVARRRPPLVTPDQAKRLGFTPAEITKALRAVGADRTPLGEGVVRRIVSGTGIVPVWLRRLQDEKGMAEAKRFAEHARRTAPDVRLFQVDLAVVDRKISSGEEFNRDERIAFERIVEDAIEKRCDGDLLSEVEHFALRRAEREGSLVF